MAEPEERSLDDFFAKRDKKKKKEKGGGSGGPAASKGTARTADGAQSTLTSLGGAAKSARKEKSGKNESQDTQQEKVEPAGTVTARVGSACPGAATLQGSQHKLLCNLLVASNSAPYLSALLMQL